MGDPVKRAEKKPWYKSRTLWFNALVGGLGAAQAVLTSGATGWDLISIAVANGALRGATSQGVGLK